MCESCECFSHREGHIRGSLHNITCKDRFAVFGYFVFILFYIIRDLMLFKNTQFCKFIFLYLLKKVFNFVIYAFCLSPFNIIMSKQHPIYILSKNTHNL